MVVGGDGTPGVGTTYHTFVNVGKRIASSFEIFMIFWAECSEDSDFVRKYISKLTKDLVELEKNVYHVTVKGVQYPMEFRVSLLSNNMKNAAFLAGELANSAFYFSSYANINDNTKLYVNLEFTMDTSAKKKLMRRKRSTPSK